MGNNLEKNSDEIIDEPDPNIEYACSPVTNSTGFTKLMMLVMSARKNPDSLECIGKLIKKGKTIIDIKNTKGWTALMMAARNSNLDSNIETVKLLIAAGANVNLQHNDGWSALMLAARYSNIDSNIETVKLLIEAGANINLQENNGWSALMMAAGNSNTDSNIETVKLLIQAGANINLQQNNGWSALMIAAKYFNTDSNIETVKLLIEAGSNIYLLNNNGQHTTSSVDIEVIKIYEKYKIEQAQIKTLKNINYQRILKRIPIKCNEIKFKPGSIGSKIMKLSFKLKNGKILPNDIYQKMVKKNNFILDYLNIASFDTFVNNISAYVNFSS